MSEQALTSGIAAALATVRREIAAAATGAGRSPADLTLVAVSKTQPVEALEAALAAYRAGKVDDAREAVIAAYFGSFEDRKFEAALRKEIGQQHITEVEARFNAVRKGVSRGGAVDEIAATVADLAKTLREDARLLDERKVPEAVYVGR